MKCDKTSEITAFLKGEIPEGERETLRTHFDQCEGCGRELQRFDRPTLVVWGGADPYMPLEWAHWLEKQVPGVRRVVVIPDGRLFFPEEEHARFSDELRQFWTDVDRQAPGRGGEKLPTA